MNALMALPNLVALLMLSGVIVVDTKKFLWDEGGLEAENTEHAKEIA
jgi:AGCS family alanine or glycine:cation symporter